MTADEDVRLAREGRRRLGPALPTAPGPPPAEWVWAALTDDEQLAGWFPTTIEGERETGRRLRRALVPLRKRGRPSRGRCWCSSRRRSWSCAGPTTSSASSSSRTGVAASCSLTVTFPEHGKAARDAAGRHVCLEQLDHARGRRTGLPWEPADRWRAVHPGYVARLGPGSLEGRPTRGVGAGARHGRGRRVSELTGRPATRAGRGA